MLTFAPREDVSSRDVPLLVSGRALPEVPPSHRTIFQSRAPQGRARGTAVRDLLVEAFDREDLRVVERASLGALLLKGRPDTLARAVAMIEVLDQPLLRGQHSILLEPAFMSAAELAGALDTVLRRRRGTIRASTPPLPAVCSCSPSER